jgi:hypothetical protein
VTLPLPLRAPSQGDLVVCRSTRELALVIESRAEDRIVFVRCAFPDGIFMLTWPGDVRLAGEDE